MSKWRAKIAVTASFFLSTIAYPIVVDQGWLRYNVYVLPCILLSAVVMYTLLFLHGEWFKSRANNFKSSQGVLVGLMTFVLLFGSVGILYGIGFYYSLRVSKEHIAAMLQREAPVPNTMPPSQTSGASEKAKLSLPTRAAKPEQPREKQSGETKPHDLGVHSPNETVTIPPNSSATFAYGNISPTDEAGLARMEKQDIEAKEHLTKDPDRLTLHDLFLTDFVVGDADTTSSNRSGFTLRNNKTGALTHIEYIVVRQLETGNKFLLFYVLYTSETESICKDLADKYAVALNSFLEGRVETQKTPGDAEATSSQNLVFSGRIFIYHETYLSPEQVIAVRNAYEKRGFTVVLRSTDYLDNQKLKAKLKHLESKH